MSQRAQRALRVPPLPLFGSRHQIINRYLHGFPYFCAGAELLAYVLLEKTSTTPNHLLITSGLFRCLLHYFVYIISGSRTVSVPSSRITKVLQELERLEDIMRRRCIGYRFGDCRSLYSGK
ncbi:hypothetical protein Zmor_010533 [Zophobas morio]|uniref:Uncharacterized protein n=1 Tax=Zophobas morio TaxID=2755281 RepID=A0AA38IR80_9CUCU|nr:hypothetical protein Zmor_010533 [Zophobas morio]